MSGRIKVQKSESAASTLPEIGKIKIGEKKKIIKNDREIEIPTSLDYFRATGNFALQFDKVFGPKPKKLNVVFISDNLDEVCNERFECWQGSKRYGWGDGETFQIWNSEKKDYATYLVTDDTQKEYIKKFKWERMLTLRFVLLEMKGIMGYWSFSTKAKETTIPSIVKAFDFVQARAKTIVAFPFTLTVEKVSSYSPGEAKNYPTVKLVPNFSQESIDMVREYLTAGNAANELSTKMIEATTVISKELPPALSSGSSAPSS